jgi:hypothetical protein
MIKRTHKRHTTRVLREGEAYPYEIIKHISGKPGGEIVGVVIGATVAARTVERLNSGLTDDERNAGYSHFCQRTTKRPMRDQTHRQGQRKPQRYKQ